MEKSIRILSMYDTVVSGGIVHKHLQAEKFKVSDKTIQRDIDDMRAYLSEIHMYDSAHPELIYSKKYQGYMITHSDFLDNSEIFAICKILLESRGFTIDEMNNIIKKLLNCCAPVSEYKRLKRLIFNELYNYVPVHHKRSCISSLWDISYAISERKYLDVSYTKLKNHETVTRRVEPVGLLFSDYYFYMAAYIKDKETEFPTIYRLDRIQSFSMSAECYSEPRYTKKFEEGEFRKRIQFMYSGDLQKIIFKYKGEGIESILDRLPTAEIIDRDGEEYTIKAEVFGQGIKRWILSQEDKIEILEPQKLREEMKEIIIKLSEKYFT